MKKRVKMVSIIALVAIIMIGVGNFKPLNAKALDVNLVESNVQVKEGKSYQLLNSTRKFQIYVKTLHQEGYPEQGGVLNTGALDSTLGTGGVGGTWNVTISSIKDGYTLKSVTWDWGNASWDGTTLVIKSNGKKDGNATFLFEFTGFNVTYNLGNFGTFNENGLNTITVKSAHGEAAVPQYTLNPGASFSGWDNSLDINSSRTLNAQGTFDVTFDSKGGSAVQKVAATAGQGITEPTAPTRMGSTFGGWYSDESLNERYVFGTPVNSPTTLFAKWNVKWYTLKFFGQGAESASVPTERSVAYGSKLGALSVPIRKGFSFDGWNTLENGQGEFLTADSVMDDADINLYAQWTAALYTIDFNLNGHTGETPASQSHYYEQKLTPVASPVRERYRFLGWNTREDGKGLTWHFETDTVDSSLTLFAKWEAIKYYTVNFRSNGSDYGTPITEVEEGTKISAPSVPQLAGRSFEGWYLDAEFTSQWDFNTNTVLGDTTLHAKWKANTYTVAFDKNGAWTTVPSQQRVVYGTKILTPLTPKKIGYVFAGWKTEQGQVWHFNETAMTAGDLTLKADWTPITYKISFIANADGVANVPPTLSAAYKSAVTLPTATPSRSGYIFTGWNTQPNGAGQRAESLFAGGMVVNDVRLYAQWKKA